MHLRRVVVTGLGAITPLGNSVPDFWLNLLKGVSGAGPITQFEASKIKTRFVCEVKGYDPLMYFEKRDARKLDLFTQYAVSSAVQAVDDAKLDLNQINKDRAGVIWGSGIGGANTFFEESLNFAKGDGTPRINPFFIPKMIVDIASGQISIRFGFRGINFTTVSACASSTNAIIDAFNYIRLNKADFMIAGGSESVINPICIGGFNAMHALSVRNDSPQTASRPFDLDRDGFVIGEGGVSLILEDYEHAKKRGAKIYAEVAGGGMSADAHHITAPHPEGLGALNVMKNALQDANMQLSEIDYINVHGTSTPLGDISESKAILNVFGEHAYNLNISSTKSMTGHLLGAAGAIEAMASILAVVNDVVPPTINHFTDDPQIDNRLNFTFNKSQKRIINAALSNTFGFGGHNATVIFKKFKD
jgi:3-oxoacyl-[acyl-carrier-protein] synthase II